MEHLYDGDTKPTSPSFRAYAFPPTPRIEINRKSSDAVPASRKASMEKMFTVGQLFIFLHLFYL